MRNRKYRLQHDLTFLTASMFITICLWIGFNIYDSYVTSTIDEILQMQIIPIEGNFDVSTIQKLKSRKDIKPDFGDLIASDEALIDLPQIQEEPQTINPTPENTIDSETTLQQPTVVQNDQVPVEGSQ